MQIDGSLRSLLQGVSQQHRRDRLDGQCTEQVNMTADVVRNLVRRPASHALADLMTTTDAVKWHLHDAGDEKYLVAIRLSAGGTAAIKVFDLAGVEQTVTAPVLTYLAAADDIESDLSCTTIGDYTIVANQKVVAAMSADVQPQAHGAIIQIRQGGVYSKKYTIYIGGVQAATYTTPSTGTTNLGTTDIAANLLTNFNAGTFDNTYTMTRWGSYLQIVRISGTAPIDISTADDSDDASMVITQSVVQRISELPRICIKDKVVKIVGADKSGQNDYYLRYDKESTELDVVGTWVEAAAPGVSTTLDADTMPHALVRTSPGQFYFGPLDGSTQDGVTLESWVKRDAGDDDSNPIHSFVGQGITYVTQFSNRLVILAGEYCSLSKTNSFFNFFNKSAVTTVDDDPIELTTPTSEYTTFRSAIQHNRSLIVFSDNAQFVIKGIPKITPSNAAMTLATAYPADLGQSVPLSIGGSIFFPYLFGNYVGVRDFLTGASADQNLADSITEHVRTYIKGNSKQLIGSANLGTAFVRASGAPTNLFMYQFLWSGQERAQSAWSRWEFPHEIATAHIVGNSLYLVFKDGSKFILVHLDLGDEPLYSFNYNVYADLLVEAVPVDRVVSYPYVNGYAASDLVAVVADGEPNAGAAVQIVSVAGTNVTLRQDVGKVIIGVRFRSSYKPTMPMMRDNNKAKISTDALVLLWFLVSVVDSYEFDAAVTSRYKDTTIQHVRTSIMGSSIIGDTAMESGTYNVSVLEDADLAEIEFYTNSPYPLNIVDIEYRGQFQKRGYRV